MISHFSWKPLFPKEKLPGWKISFYYKGPIMKASIIRAVRLNGETCFPPALTSLLLQTRYMN
ncbi:hypothetical protein B4073_0952 [Bacillus subtilis]|nr:hypothetical protein B4068_0963 [Bacillus subtilis]KIN49495.1 hypothetical protein B4073_0952 [Bacillus subtilis]